MTPIINFLTQHNYSKKVMACLDSLGVQTLRDFHLAYIRADGPTLLARCLDGNENEAQQLWYSILQSDSLVPEMFDDVIGKSYQEAKLLYPGVSWRVTRLDGQPQMVTMDFRTDRINVAIRDGLIDSVESVS